MTLSDYIKNAENQHLNQALIFSDLVFHKGFINHFTGSRYRKTLLLTLMIYLRTSIEVVKKKMFY